MSTTFADLLKAKADQAISASQSKLSTKPSLPVAKQPEPIEALKITVDLVLDRNRIDLYFNRKPDETVLGTLRLWKWHYRPSDRAWYHQDNEHNRRFLAEQFGCKFDDNLLPDKSENSDNSNNSIVPVTADNDQPSTYDRYRSQVDELLQHTKVEAADLIFMAIDCLHKQTFGTN